jgi:hypothetical protein
MIDQAQETRKATIAQLKTFISDPAGLCQNRGLGNHPSVQYIQRAFGAAYSIVEETERPIREKYIAKEKEIIDKNAKGVYVFPTKEGIQRQYHYEPVSKWNETEKELQAINEEMNKEMGEAYKKEVELNFDMIPEGSMPPFQVFPLDKQSAYYGILIPDKNKKQAYAKEKETPDTTSEKGSKEVLETLPKVN